MGRVRVGVRALKPCHRLPALGASAQQARSFGPFSGFGACIRSHLGSREDLPYGLETPSDATLLKNAGEPQLGGD